MDFWGVAIGAGIASAAWLYQRAWERQEKRIARYQEVMDRLKWFTVNRLSPNKLNEMIDEHHRLWLFAPDYVIDAGEKFLDSVEGLGGSPETSLSEYVLAMRRDSTLGSALWPRFWRTRISPSAFRLRTARGSSATASQSDVSAPRLPDSL